MDCYRAVELAPDSHLLQPPEASPGDCNATTVIRPP